MGPPMTSKHDEVIELRKAGLSYAKIGSRLGISRERARQIFKGKPIPEKPALGSKIMLSIGDVASLLGVSVNTVRRWGNKGILKAYRIGPRADRRFRREDVDAFLGEEKAGDLPDPSE